MVYDDPNEKCSDLYDMALTLENLLTDAKVYCLDDVHSCLDAAHIEVKRELQAAEHDADVYNAMQDAFLDYEYELTRG